MNVFKNSNFFQYSLAHSKPQPLETIIMDFIKIRSCFTGFASLLIFLFFVSLGIADAGFLNLNSLQHGEMATTQIPGVTIIANNLESGPEKATIFDRRLSGTPKNDGSIDTLPNGSGSNLSDTTTFDFDISNISFAFDLIDIDQSLVENRGAFVEFYDRGFTIETVRFNDTKARSSTESYKHTGNNALNRIEPLTVSELSSWFDRSMSTTSLDNLVKGFNVYYKRSDSTVQPVPKPFTTVHLITILLFGFGLVGSYAGFRWKLRKN